ncbi:MAG: hypothetical protein Kilf2KO_32420 [Rhodospirillales bacterium]
MSDTAAPKGERIAKVIARSGYCSRREAEALIQQGRVELDGETVVAPGTTVTPERRVTIDGEKLPPVEAARLFRFHKPVHVLTAARDPEGRRVFGELLPPELPRLMPVGRLDMTSEGLLLLTNDGGLKRHLELPATGWLRRYRVRVYGQVEQAVLATLEKGLVLDGERFGPIRATLDRVQGHNAWMTVSLREGKNREVRRVCQHLGLTVNRLIRISYGPFQLGALRPGEVEEVPGKVLREQLGRFLPAAAGQGKPKENSRANRRR